MEISEFFGVDTVYNGFELMEYAKKMQRLGAKNVLVSLGGDGAMLVTENGDVYVKAVPKGELINSVGAGDSMVAGFLVGATVDYDYALRLGIAAGGATAQSMELATKEEILALL